MKGGTTMICEQLNTCDFMINLSSLMPFTAHMVKAIYCESIEDGCGKDHEHVILPIDQDPGNLLLCDEMKTLELKEIKLNETYSVHCIRCRENAPVKPLLPVEC
jgi:hypothetical protein